MKVNTLVIISLTLILLTFSSQSKAQSIPSYVSERHKQILRNYLAQRKGLKFETMPKRNPYSAGINHYANYAVGDFNGDGKEDFAVLLNKGGNNLVIVIFNGPLNEKTSPAFYLENLVAGDEIFWMNDRSFGRRIIVGFPETDSGTMIAWRHGHYTTK